MTEETGMETPRSARGVAPGPYGTLAIAVMGGAGGAVTGAGWELPGALIVALAPVIGTWRVPGRRTLRTASIAIALASIAALGGFAITHFGI